MSRPDLDMFAMCGLNRDSSLSGAYIEKSNTGFKLVFPSTLKENTTYKFDYIIVGLDVASK